MPLHFVLYKRPLSGAMFTGDVTALGSTPVLCFSLQFLNSSTKPSKIVKILEIRDNQCICALCLCA